MEILTVVYNEDGYIVNGTLSVPKDDRNRHYRLIQEWLLIDGNRVTI